LRHETTRAIDALFVLSQRDANDVGHALGGSFLSCGGIGERNRKRCCDKELEQRRFSGNHSGELWMRTLSDIPSEFIGLPKPILWVGTGVTPFEDNKRGREVIAVRQRDPRPDHAELTSPG
jgi:hypothetical protein